MIKFDSVEDSAHIKSYQRGDFDALDTLIKKYYIYIYKILCYKGVGQVEAEDFTHDICIRLIDALKEFKHECTFKTYLDKIINNKVIDYYRNSKNAKTFSLFATLFSETGEEVCLNLFDSQHTETTEQDVLAEELKKVIENCLASIGNKAMQQLVHLWLDGFKRKQMAELLDVTLGYVNGTLERGKTVFRDCVRKKWDYFENYAGV